MSWANPLYLFFGFLALIPLAVHLFSFRQTKRTYFSNIQFLKEVLVQSKKMSQTKHRLLLAARILAVLCLVAAFAQPFFANQLAAENTGGSTLVIIDASASTMETIERSPVLSKIVAKAEEDKKLLKANKLALALEKMNRRNVRSAYILSDFQNGFTNLETLKSGKNRLHIVPLAEFAPGGNVSVDSVWTEQPFLRSGTTYPLHIQLCNQSETDKRDVLVELKLGNISVASKTVDLEAKGKSNITFNYQYNTPKDAVGIIRIEDGSWTFDNQLYFTAAPTKTITVALISDKPNNPIAIAYQQEAIFKVGTYLPGAVGSAQLENADLIVLDAEQNISPMLWQVLERHKKSGKSVCIFPSSKWDNSSTEAASKLCGTVVGLEAEPKTNTVGLPDSQNPFFHGVFEHKPENSDKAQVRRILLLANSGEKLLGEQNTVLASRSRFEKGQTFLFSFALDGQQTLTRNALFLPLLYKMAESAANPSTRLYYRMGQDRAIALPLNDSSSSSSNELYNVRNGNTSLLPDQKNAASQKLLFLPSEGLPLGHYTILDKQNKEKGVFGLNSSRDESKEQFIPTNELKSAQLANKNLEIVSADDLADTFSSTSANLKEWGNWHYLILAVALLFVAEAFLSKKKKTTPSLQN